MDKIQTGFRISEAMHEEIEQTAKEYEISKNALMTMAMRIGLNHLRRVNQPQEE